MLARASRQSTACLSRDGWLVLARASCQPTDRLAGVARASRQPTAIPGWLASVSQS